MTKYDGFVSNIKVNRLQVEECSFEQMHKLSSKAWETYFGWLEDIFLFFLV